MSIHFNALIFDLDGVIVHTDRYHFLAWKALADRLGLPFDESVNNRLRGVSRIESLNIILENSALSKLPPDDKKALASEKNETYKRLLQSMTLTDLSGEAKNTLHTLRQRGYRLAIGSSSCNARLILKKIGLDGFFDAVSDGNNIINSKPDPEVFLKAAGFLAIPPELCAVIEDADAGIEAAHRAGMKAVAMGDAVRHGNGDWDIQTFGDLLTLFP